MKHAAFPRGITREDLIQWYRAGRQNSKAAFSIPAESTYYERPIDLRNPIVFYEGHLPAFAVNTLIKLALKGYGIDEHYEVLFARGIDPDSVDAVKDPADVWPRREQVQAYGRTADAMIEDALKYAVIEDDSVPQLRGGEAAIAILEHEQMHQETLMYMFHNLPYEKKRKRAPLGVGQPLQVVPFSRDRIHIPAGTATLGASRDQFGWDNELPSLRVDVPEFDIDRHSVTNGDYLAFMQATGASAPHFWLERDGAWYWRGMFALARLPLDAPVWATKEQADEFARWRGGRVMTEGEYHRAAFGTQSGEERLYPWGDELPDATRGNFGFTHWDPVPIGSYPAGASAWGVHDLVGNGWEWTSTPFDGFPGFEPMPSYPVYSSDFFDCQHFVIKGASPATAPQLVRRSFRNWFRGNYPYVYAKFRCVY
ncbi:MAG TPA: SUMF1/EgtB/PvdO family nonheme iron enzyme [Thermoanaerobaculia bacterium]|nr:SUMF1/EgtB/PvdO family nonheme iron enzyme [Thermoanaerobaculia bacterium]